MHSYTGKIWQLKILSLIFTELTLQGEINNYILHCAEIKKLLIMQVKMDICGSRKTLGPPTRIIMVSPSLKWGL